MTNREFQVRLARRAKRAGVSVHTELAERLETYFRLLTSWNRKINLTGLNLAEPTPETFDRLLIEPLIAARHVSAAGQRVIDIGSGGGSPAIPMALAVPNIELLMVESKARKAVFLREAIRVLEMSHADVASCRFEELLGRPDLHEAHDLLTIRAVRVEARILMSLQAFLRPGGTMFLFRGPSTMEPETITPPLFKTAIHPLIESLRSRLVILEKRHIGR